MAALHTIKRRKAEGLASPKIPLWRLCFINGFELRNLGAGGNSSADAIVDTCPTAEVTKNERKETIERQADTMTLVWLP